MNYKKICRISGFLIALIFLVFFSFMLISEEFENIKNFSLPKGAIIHIILSLICFAALILSIKKQNLGGWILIISGIAWFIFMLVTNGIDNIGIALLFGLVFTVSGVLFLPWQKK